MAVPINIKSYSKPKSGFGKFASAVGGFLGGPIGGLLGTVAGGLFSAKGAADRNRQQMLLAQKQMDFQERMSSTAHQREPKNKLINLTSRPTSNGLSGRTRTTNIIQKLL